MPGGNKTHAGSVNNGEEQLASTGRLPACVLCDGCRAERVPGLVWGAQPTWASPATATTLSITAGGNAVSSISRRNGGHIDRHGRGWSHGAYAWTR
jgi:hypothetical protein